MKKIDNKLIEYGVVSCDQDNNRLILLHDDIVEYNSEQIGEGAIKFIENLLHKSHRLDPVVRVTIRCCYGFRKIEKIEEITYGNSWEGVSIEYDGTYSL